MSNDDTEYVWVAEAYRYDERVEQTIHVTQEDAWDHINAVAENEYGPVTPRVEKHELHSNGSARPAW